MKAFGKEGNEANIYICISKGKGNRRLQFLRMKRQQLGGFSLNQSNIGLECCRVPVSMVEKVGPSEGH